MREILNSPANLQNAFLDARDQTIELCQPLAYDDYLVQSADFVSPPKWHLGHTTWFFETFVLQPYCKTYQTLNPKYGKIFNSYYQTVDRVPDKTRRGIAARPTLEEVLSYREYVDEALLKMLSGPVPVKAVELVELGIQHEEQHQELLLMDVQHIFYSSPIQPLYENHLMPVQRTLDVQFEFIQFPGGRLLMGATELERFSFDNEHPRHEVLLRPYQLANRLVSNGDYLEFIDAGGYENPEYWLSDGWDQKTREGWIAPLYWEKSHGDWHHFTLRGNRKLVFDEPVSHLNYFEADAFARWSKARLPTEFEWEAATAGLSADGCFLESGEFHPMRPPHPQPGMLNQMFGDLWEWTASSFSPYPGHRRQEGFLGEYNSKFMCNQIVLRGGSFATPKQHIRASYRNFYGPNMRWQFCGLRLAKDSE